MFGFRFLLLLGLSFSVCNQKSYAEVIVNAEPYFIGGLSFVNNNYASNVDGKSLANNMGAGFAGIGAFFSEKFAFEMNVRYSPSRNKLDSNGGSSSINTTTFNWDMLYYLRSTSNGGFNIFALGGLAFVATNIDTQASFGSKTQTIGSSGWGYNAGAGVEYDISNRSAIRLDARYTGLFNNADIKGIISGNVGMRFKF